MDVGVGEDSVIDDFWLLLTTTFKHLYSIKTTMQTTVALFLTYTTSIIPVRLQAIYASVLSELR